jgi:uncharacterized protein (DUF2225 family)
MSVEAMLAKILEIKEVSCPVCKKRSKTLIPNPRYYVAADRESDLHAIYYRWADGMEIDILPHHYDIWQCPQCKFASFIQNVINSSNSRNFDLIIKRFAAATEAEKLVLTSLDSLVEKSTAMDMESVLGRHLAALYIATLEKDPESANFNDRARLALRSGWLYRESGIKENEETVVTVEEDESNSNIDIAKNKCAEIEQNLNIMESLMGEIQKFSLDDEFPDITDPDKPKKPISTIVFSLRVKRREMFNLLTQLRTQLNANQHILTSPISDDMKSKLGDKTVAVFSQIRQQWPELPTSESDALTLAADYFDYSYNHELSYQSTENSIAIISLIVDLLTRIGKFEEALSYVGNIYSSGMSSKTELQDRMRAGIKAKTISPHDEKMLKSKIARIDVSIRQAGETRREMILNLLGSQMDLITKTIAPVLEGTAEEQVTALKKAGIRDEIIKELANRGTIKKAKKGGFFGR